MRCFAQETCLHVIPAPSSVHRGSERCPIRSCRTQLGCWKRNTVAALKEVLSLGCYRVESQQTPLPRPKYRAIVPGRWAPHSGHFRPTPRNHIKGKASRGKAQKPGWLSRPRAGRVGPPERRLLRDPRPRWAILALVHIGTREPSSVVRHPELELGGIP